jgi:hypothetical protein
MMPGIKLGVVDHCIFFPPKYYFDLGPLSKSFATRMHPEPKEKMEKLIDLIDHILCFVGIWLQFCWKKGAPFYLLLTEELYSESHRRYF